MASVFWLSPCRINSKGMQRESEEMQRCDFDHDEFLGKHQWCWWHEAELEVSGHHKRGVSPHLPSLWPWSLFVRSGVASVVRNHFSAAESMRKWWLLMKADEQAVKLFPAFGAAALETWNCCKFSRWPHFQIPFSCKLPKCSLQGKPFSCAVLIQRQYFLSANDSCGLKRPHASHPNIPVSQSCPQHQQGERLVFFTCFP